MTIFQLNCHPEELFQLQEINPELYTALISKDQLIEILYGKPPYNVVIGVPHQAAIGVKSIAENGRERASDEGAAFYALVAFLRLKEQQIPCKIVISAHDTQLDPNKDSNSSYWKSIFANEMKLLLECHGAKKDVDKIDLEISSGKNTYSHPLIFGRELAKETGYKYGLVAQKDVCSKDGIQVAKDGETPKCLRNAAIRTASLVEANCQKIPALHIEATPKFRIPEDNTNTVTHYGLVLGEAIGRVLIALFISEKPNIKILNHYTKLFYMLQMIIEKKIFLTKPCTWEDKNDVEAMKQYQCAVGRGNIYAICFEGRRETIHHWKAYAGGVTGCCIEFNKENLINHLKDQDDSIKYGNVNYLEIKKLKVSNFHIDCLPFIKRIPYQFEHEYRVIWVNNGSEDLLVKEFELDTNTINKITISYFMPYDDYRIIKNFVDNKLGRDVVNQSTIYENDEWITEIKRIGNGY